MRADDVLKLYNFLEEHGINIWVDGGWCVDALLGMQTRKHPDLDIAVQRKDNEKLRALLSQEGFKEQAHNDSTDWGYVLVDSDNHQIDIHVFEYDDSGENTYGIEYPYGSLTGLGKIKDRAVNCISPKWMYKFKTSYEPKEKDKQDVLALADKFGFKVPEGY